MLSSWTNGDMHGEEGGGGACGPKPTRVQYWFEIYQFFKNFFMYI